jgi:sialate O-acetylesterase
LLILCGIIGKVFVNYGNSKLIRNKFQEKTMKKQFAGFTTLTLRAFFFVILIGSIMRLSAQYVQLQVASIFQNNMVLQQQSNVPIWGKGTPGSEIVLRTSWGKVEKTRIDSNGAWLTKLATPKAGGPFQISLSSGKIVMVLHNVMIGEVWLCSGQSNMEMPLEGWPPSDTILNSEKDIEQALYPNIRLFTVRRAFEAAPRTSCEGNWVECSPTNVRSFSATAFHFGKKLAAELKVPIGLINSSFGGTFVEAWMSKEALAPFQEYSDLLNKLAGSREKLEAQDRWINQHPMIRVSERNQLAKWDGLKFQDEDCAQKNYVDSTWREMKLPTLWEQTPVGNFDGVVWFRKQVVIPSDWKGKELTLQLGPIDDMDETFVNGQKVGQYLTEGFWSTNRIYKVPGSISKDSILQIAVRVIDLQGGGGLWGKGTNLVLYADDIKSGISLESEWKYLPVAEYRAGVFYIYGAVGKEFYNRPELPFGFSADTPTSLFNGMINPLIPFTIKGVIWYQGENNVSNPAPYKSHFTAMITDWRSKFSCGDFPFLFVQLAPYDYGTNSKSQLLREAQFQTLSVKNTGMVVTLDIGNPKNIHPANKGDVGKRLANWALSKTYGKKIAFSGPIYKSMKIGKGKIILSFDNAGAGLVVKELNGSNNFLIAGEDKVFKKANVKVEERTLVISSSEVKIPAAIRYTWSNTDEGTFFNKEGLPSPSFRTDNWAE